MNFEGTEPILVTLSQSNIREAIKEYLHRSGYAKGKTEYIADISVGALHENEVPVQIWIETDGPQEQEVTLISYNGKGSKAKEN